ncbi:MAG: type II CAAX endopeptidase family protein [Syntrophomonas sp.]|nr:type II CAAX endopeptidase family protein [Syntrophomonas sp.]
MAHPRWGFIDIIVVYIAIMALASTAAVIPLLRGMDPIHFFIYLFGAQFIATVLCVFLAVVVFRKSSWADLGWKRAGLRDLVNYGLKGGLLLIVLVALMGYVLQFFQPDLQMQEIEQVMRSATRLPDIAALVLAGTVLAPVSEELFYRGMIYPVLRQHLGPAWGAVLAGLIFGLAHWDPWRALPLAVGGAVLCYMYEKSGSVLVPMVAHGLWNGAMFAIILFSNSLGIN